MNKERISFCLKLVTKYFLYGYLCLLGIILCANTAIILHKVLIYPQKLLFIIPIFISLPILGQFLKIAASTHHKYRYYKISLYRLKTRGYKDDYFECEMHEPCFRLIIRDILLERGYKKEYFALRSKCKGRNLRVEKAKINLLKKVQKQNLQNLN